MSGNEFIGDREVLAGLEGATGFVAVPASDADPLATPTRGIVITSDGDLGVVLADGTDNDSTLLPVTASPWPLPFHVLQLTASNTAGVLGLA